MKNENIEIAFVGGVLLEENHDYIISNSIRAIQNAADILQRNYIKGIDINTNKKTGILNCTFVGTYPRSFKKILFKGCGLLSEIRKIYDCSFLNLPVFGGLSKYRNLLNAYDKLYANQKPEIVIAYGFFEENIRLLANIKQNNKGTKTCLIIPDLPEYMSNQGSQSIVHKLLINRIYNIFKRNKEYIDYYSVITPQMAEHLSLKKSQYVVIDGMVGKVEECENRTYTKDSNKFIFMYSGGLSKSYGTEQMLSSFSSIDNANIELWICGDGPFKEDVVKAAETDSRIKYFGVVSQEECHDLQRQASCLINPRDDSIITRYSFPSKTMEYLASGVPVIAKRLTGMDSEYSDFFIEFSDKRSLEEVMKSSIMMRKDQLNQYGIKGRDFVRKNKTCERQTRKLLELMGVNCLTSVPDAED